MDTYASDLAGIGPAFAAAAGIMLFLLAIGIGFYLLFSFGLYRLAKNNGDEMAWLAFIPVGNYFTIGSLIRGNFTVFGRKIEKAEMVLLIGNIIGAVLSGIPFLGFLFGIALLILDISAIYHIYRKYKGEKAMVYTVLSIFLPFLYPIFIFMMRNDGPVDLSYGTGNGYYGAQNNGAQNQYNGSFDYTNYYQNNSNDDTSQAYHVSDSNQSDNNDLGGSNNQD